MKNTQPTPKRGYPGPSQADLDDARCAARQPITDDISEHGHCAGLGVEEAICGEEGI